MLMRQNILTQYSLSSREYLPINDFRIRPVLTCTIAIAQFFCVLSLEVNFYTNLLRYLESHFSSSPKSSIEID